MQGMFMRKRKRRLKQALAAQLAALCLCTGTVYATDFTEDAEYHGSGASEVINAAAAYQAGYTGKGIIVAISDDYVNLAHPDFASKDYITYINAPDSDFNWELNTHGTHVAGIATAARNGSKMHGVAYDAGVISVDKNDDDGFSEIDPSKVKLVNASWAGHRFPLDYGNEDYFESFEELQDADFKILSTQKIAAEKGLLYIHAMGNDGYVSGEVTSWADLLVSGNLSLINVTNLNEKSMVRQSDGTISGSVLLDATSNLALLEEERTLAAPGVRIYAPNANFASDGELYIEKYGTSMAAPVVTGVGALVQEAHPYLSANQIGEVLLTTANTTIKDYNTMQVSLCNTDGDWKINVYYINSDRPATDEEIIAAFKKIVGDSEYLQEDFGNEGDWRINPDDISNYNIYTYVPLEEFVGRGVVDAGKAVQGLGSINMRRMTADNIKSLDMDNDGTAETTQAFFRVDTQGYDAVWSNDITEVQADKISADSSEEDLQARYKYYYTNFISEESKVATGATRALIRDYIKNYNQNLEDSGLIGLHGGILKQGEGTLTLTGNNTYLGTSVAQGGVLAIDGSVAGDALSTDSGVLAGGGTIYGTLYNQNKVVPGSPEALNDNPTLTANGYVGSGDVLVQQFNIGTEEYVITNLAINGEATITGNDAKVVLSNIGDELLPVEGTTVITSKKLNGSFANAGKENGETVSDTLSMYVRQVGNDVQLVLDPTLHLTSPSAGVQTGFAGLNEVYSVANAQNNSNNLQMLAKIYGLKNGAARPVLDSISGQDLAAGVGRAQRFNLANATIAPRLMQNLDKPMPGSAGIMDADGYESRSGAVIELHDDPLEGGWMKYTHTWNDIDDGKSHGSIMTFGYDKKMGRGRRAGVFGSYGTDSYANGTASSKLHDWRLGVYGGFQRGAADGYVYADYGWQKYEDKRTLSYFGDKFDTTHKGHLLEVGGEYRYDLNADTNKLWHVRPYANVQLSRAFMDGYSEDTQNLFGQRVSSSTQDYAASELGLDFYRAVGTDGAYTARLGYKRVFAGADPNYRFSYLGGDGTLHTNTVYLGKNLLTAKLQQELSLGHGWKVRGEAALERGEKQRNVIAGLSAMYNW